MILEYVTDTLTRFRHDHPRKPQHHPYLHVKTRYGAKAQYVEDADVSLPLSKEDTKLYRKSQESFYIMHEKLILLC